MSKLKCVDISFTLSQLAWVILALADGNRRINLINTYV